MGLWLQGLLGRPPLPAGKLWWEAENVNATVVLTAVILRLTSIKIFGK